MRWRLALVFLTLPFLAAASPYPVNEQPMFGGQPKTPEMQAADRQFLAGVEKLGYSRAQGSDKEVALGWQYFFQRHDTATAMKRFNQAWLLDPDNGDAFHGFAVLVMSRDHDVAEADALFQQGIAKSRQSPGIYLDYGRFLLTAGRPAEAVPQLRKALTFSNMGPDAEALLTLALAGSGDRPAACAESAKISEGAQAVLRHDVKAICP